MFQVNPLLEDADANANADADTDAGGSTIALPGLRPGKLKMKLKCRLQQFKG